MRILKKYWWVLLFLILALGIGGTVMWGMDAREATPAAQPALESNTQVTVTTDPWLTFTPVDTPPTSGFIFYPGAKVLPEAYAPLMQEIAAAGYLVVVPDMPLNFAVFAPNKANDIIAAYPDIENWAIGGHSLGGAMAGKYVYDHPGTMAGLVLWAAYLAESNDISDQPIAVSSISGSLDGLATPEKIANTAHLLPADTTWVIIEGGNHAQFGVYGEQEGDNPATISPEEQQTQIVAATIALLETIDTQ